MSKKSLLRYWKDSKLIKNDKLLKAFEEIPREKFVLDDLVDKSYDDNPLPILGGQTISQPTTIMLMLDALDLKKTDKVLEIGTGSGYNAALISKLARNVYTIEYVKELYDFAKENLKKVNIKNVTVIHGDGSKGYEKEAPYDKIIVTAASPDIPSPLIEQLKENGILIAPVGYNQQQQKMIKITKEKGKLIREDLGDFAFVPLRGEYGFT